jgi:hypothetical protein
MESGAQSERTDADLERIKSAVRHFNGKAAKMLAVESPPT